MWPLSLLARRCSVYFVRRLSVTVTGLSGGQYNPANRYPAYVTQGKRHIIPKSVNIPKGRGCPLCRYGLEKFGYEDVLVLRQFLTPEGYLMNRRKTGVCPKMQRRLAKTIRRSRQVGLLPNFRETS